MLTTKKIHWLERLSTLALCPTPHKSWVQGVSKIGRSEGLDAGFQPIPSEVFLQDSSPVCCLFSIFSVPTSKLISFSCMLSWGVWARLFLLSISILSSSQFPSWISRDCKARGVLKGQWNGCLNNLIFVKQLSWHGRSNKKLSKLKEHEAFEPKWLKSDNIRSN